MPGRGASEVDVGLGASVVEVLERFGHDPGFEDRAPGRIGVKRQLCVPLGDDYSSPRSAQHSNHSSAPFLFGSFSL